MYWISGIAKGGKAGKASNVLRVLRLLRLSRALRVTRLIRHCPELLFLTKGLLSAVRSVMAVLLLLVIVIYIFAVLFTQLLSDSDVGQGNFEGVLMGMNFLLLQVLCGFDQSYFAKLLEVSVLYYLLFLLFQLIASMTIMNMLIGVLCDVVSTVANAEKENSSMQEIESHIKSIQNILDVENDGHDFVITKERLDQILHDQDMIMSLHNIGVDVGALTDYCSFVFNELNFDECQGLNCKEFLQLVKQCSGDKAATVKDLNEMRKYISQEISGLEAKMLHKQAQIESVSIAPTRSTHPSDGSP